MLHCRRIALLLSLLPSALIAQTPDPVTQPSSTYTLHAGTRLVLTDLTVNDRNGNPVHGLPASAFHITEDKKPQDLASFEEHHTEAPPAVIPASAPSPANTFSNDFFLHPPPVLNILVLDTTNLPVEDQMFLSFQLTRFLEAFPAGQSLAIYGRSGPNSVLLQNFTTDRKLLLAAVTRSLPRLLPPGREYLSDLTTLQQIGDAFGDLPGRKNVLWFTGGSTLFLRQDATQMRDYDRWRRIYDELEASRIAIFPVDARGLTTFLDSRQNSQNFLMSEVAGATGGKAFYNNNGLAEIAAHVTATGGDFYTLTYSPREYREDRKWHKVQISVDGAAGYVLSYRHGYFADGVNAAQAGHPSNLNSRLIAAAGGKAASDSAGNQPILFQAHLVPAGELPAAAKLQPLDHPLKKDERLYAVRYTIPAKELTMTPADNQEQQLLFIAAAFAFNRDGSVIDRKAERISITVSQPQLKAVATHGVPLQQQLRLHKGDNFLLLAVVDPTSGRAGRIQLTFQVPANPTATP